MNDLLTALFILSKYIEIDAAPTHCEHDVLYVMVAPRKVSEQDIKLLAELGFIASEDGDTFYSYRFGSA